MRLKQIDKFYNISRTINVVLNASESNQLWGKYVYSLIKHVNEKFWPNTLIL